MKTSNRNAFFSFDHSADLLKEIYPEENWFWFLTKNIHGLTEGYSTIPYDNNTSDIAYELSDIENFAVTYGIGKFSAEEVGSMIDDHMTRIDLESMLSEIEIKLNTNNFNSKFMSQKTVHDDGSVDLCLNNPVDWMIEIKEMSDIQVETCYALTTLAHAIRMVGEGMSLSKSEAEALSGIAIAQADRAYDNADQIRSILN